MDRPALYCEVASKMRQRVKVRFSETNGLEFPNESLFQPVSTTAFCFSGNPGRHRGHDRGSGHRRRGLYPGHDLRRDHGL